MSSEMGGPGGMDMMQDQSHYRMQQQQQQQPGMTYATGLPPGVVYQGQQHQPPSGFDGQQYGTGTGQTTVYYNQTDDPAFYQVSDENRL